MIRNINISYELARSVDADEIAQLHALSWQRHYRNIYPENYLQNQVLDERRKIWYDRFSQNRKDRLVIKVLDGDKIIGFACTFLNEDPEYGALVDNLHVLEEYQRNGIGKELLRKSAEWVLQNTSESESESGLYLYVLTQNYPATAFYKSLGANMSKPFLYKNPTGSYDEVCRCSWNASQLLH